MESTLIRCTASRQYVKVILMPASEDGPSNYLPIICPACKNVHCIRRRELACRQSDSE